MDFLLYGKDARLAFLAKKLKDASHRVRFWGQEAPEGYGCIESLLELSLPVRLVLPPRVTEEKAKDALATLPVGSRVFGGKLGETGDFPTLCARRAIVWENLEKNDAYCIANAVPTAEGALHALISHKPKILSDTHAVLLGSGRVAAAVIELFSRLGVRVTLIARNREKCREAERNGISALPLPLPENAAEALGDADALINTVEAKGVVDGALLSALPQGTPILELAGGRENIVSEAALRGGHEILPLPALPGKIAPSSAADALFFAITQEG